ncbi:uncharacterized protein [Dysidea avara]|uniref:uncharacterized protein isoform X2 n=1 Tax=Dysidea avara TaxID=196820 RepID=UPI00332BFF80
MAGIVLLCLLLFGCSCFCESLEVTTQPSDIAVPSGGTAVFTCVVDLGDQNANTDDIKWDNMGNAITRASTDPYMVENDFEGGVQLISTLTIKNVNTQHAGLYQFVLNLNDGDVMSREASLIVLAATITTQPSDVTLCAEGVAVFTCVVDRNGTNITSSNVTWQQIRVGGGISTLSTSQRGVPFNITTTIAGDILTSVLMITGVKVNNILGSSSYRCLANDMMSRKAFLLISSDLPGVPMNIRFSDIYATSFVVHWDEVDDADSYIVSVKGIGIDGNKDAPTRQAMRTIMGLTPDATYEVILISINSCGLPGMNSEVFMVSTIVMTPMVGPSTSLSSSVIYTASIDLFSPRMTITTPTASSSISGGGDGDGSGDAGGIIGGVVGGIIAVIAVIMIIVVLYWFCVYKKKGQADVSKETYVALQSPTGKGTLPESQYDTVDKPGAKVVPHQSTSGVEYAVSTKTASMASLNEPSPEYAYAAVDKKKHIAASVPHQSSATGVQYAVSAKAAEAKDPHRYDEIRDEPGTSTTGAEYAVSTKATGHQYDDVKDKSPAPQGINYAEIQHEPTSGVRVALDDDSVVHYTQVS